MKKETAYLFRMTLVSWRHGMRSVLGHFASASVFSS